MSSMPSTTTTNAANGFKITDATAAVKNHHTIPDKTNGDVLLIDKDSSSQISTNELLSPLNLNNEHHELVMKETKVIYHLDEEETPYLVKIPMSPDVITLGDLKKFIFHDVNSTSILGLFGNGPDPETVSKSPHNSEHWQNDNSDQAAASERVSNKMIDVNVPGRPGAESGPGASYLNGGGEGPSKETTGHFSGRSSATGGDPPNASSAPSLPYKFFFKSMDDDFGVVKEEIIDDKTRLPSFNGRVICWIINTSTPPAALIAPVPEPFLPNNGSGTGAGSNKSSGCRLRRRHSPAASHTSTTPNNENSLPTAKHQLFHRYNHHQGKSPAIDKKHENRSSSFISSSTDRGIPNNNDDNNNQNDNINNNRFRNNKKKKVSATALAQHSRMVTQGKNYQGALRYNFDDNGTTITTSYTTDVTEQPQHRGVDRKHYNNNNNRKQQNRILSDAHHHHPHIHNKVGNVNHFQRKQQQQHQLSHKYEEGGCCNNNSNMFDEEDDDDDLSDSQFSSVTDAANKVALMHLNKQQQLLPYNNNNNGIIDERGNYLPPPPPPIPATGGQQYFLPNGSLKQPIFPSSQNPSSRLLPVPENHFHHHRRTRNPHQQQRATDKDDGNYVVEYEGEEFMVAGPGPKPPNHGNKLHQQHEVGDRRYLLPNYQQAPPPPLNQMQYDKGYHGDLNLEDKDVGGEPSTSSSSKAIPRDGGSFSYYPPPSYELRRQEDEEDEVIEEEGEIQRKYHPHPHSHQYSNNKRYKKYGGPPPPPLMKSSSQQHHYGNNNNYEQSFELADPSSAFPDDHHHHFRLAGSRDETFDEDDVLPPNTNNNNNKNGGCGGNTRRSSMGTSRHHPIYGVPSEFTTTSVTESTMSLNVITVILNMDVVNFLGISIVGKKGIGNSGGCGISVGSIMKGGAVARDGRIEPGDLILEVNGISLDRLTSEEAINVLKEAVKKPGPVKLFVAKMWDTGSVFHDNGTAAALTSNYPQLHHFNQEEPPKSPAIRGASNYVEGGLNDFVNNNNCSRRTRRTNHNPTGGGNAAALSGGSSSTASGSFRSDPLFIRNTSASISQPQSHGGAAGGRLISGGIPPTPPSGMPHFQTSGLLHNVITSGDTAHHIEGKLSNLRLNFSDGNLLLNPTCLSNHNLTKNHHQNHRASNPSGTGSGSTVSSGSLFNVTNNTNNNNLHQNTDEQHRYLLSIVTEMCLPNSGLEIKDRNWLKLTIKDAFLGSDLVEWLTLRNYIISNLPVAAIPGATAVDQKSNSSTGLVSSGANSGSATTSSSTNKKHEAKKLAGLLLKRGYVKHSLSSGTGSKNGPSFSEQCYYVINRSLFVTASTTNTNHHHSINNNNNIFNSTFALPALGTGESSSSPCTGLANRGGKNSNHSGSYITAASSNQDNNKSNDLHHQQDIRTTFAI